MQSCCHSAQEIFLGVVIQLGLSLRVKNYTIIF
jgi:hypothetical protein